MSRELEENSVKQVRNWGSPLPENKASYIPLLWKTERVEKPDDIEQVVANVDYQGVYAFVGRHDAYNGPTVLYIGRCGQGSNSDGSDGTSAQKLKERIPQSFRRHFVCNTSFYSDCWDFRVLFAKVKDVGLIASVEKLLIIAHSPPCNKHYVSKFFDDDFRLIILNCGEKRELMPVVAGIYHHEDDYFPK